MLLVLLLVTGCSKDESYHDPAVIPVVQNAAVEYVIPKGAHFSLNNPFRNVNTPEMKFVVRFDNSTMYQTVDSNNQGDINKLYGFADNNEHHHTNSARIGWRWYRNRMELLGYIYNSTVQSDSLIAAVPLNKDINCSIRVEGNRYRFTVDTTTITMPRHALTPTGVGYQLYPYFGGDEAAPHEMRIRIRDLK